MHSELMPLAFQIHSWMHSAFMASFVENPLRSALRIHIVLHSGCTQDSSLRMYGCVKVQNALQEACRMHAILHTESMLQFTQKTCQHPPEFSARMQSEAMPECIQNVGRAALRMHLGMHSEIPVQMHSGIHVTLQSQDIPKWTQGPCQNAVRSHARMLSESMSICSQSAFWNVLRIHGWMHVGF